MLFSPLTSRVRADLFAHLLATERAGVPADQAFALLHLPTKLQPRVQSAHRMVSRGVDVPTAGLTAGLFSPLEAMVLRSAFSTGDPTLTYKRLADRYNYQARQAMLIKTRMTLPLLILMIALLIEPLPALMAGTIHSLGYALDVFYPFAVIAALIFLYRFITTRLNVFTDQPTPIRMGLSILVTRIPLFGPMLTRLNVRNFYENLALMLEAGIPMFEALPKAVNTINLSVIRAEFKRIQPAMEQGMTLEEAIMPLQYQGHSAVLSLIHTGEACGELPEMLRQFADSESDTISQFQVRVAVWLPRLFYILVLLWMAYPLLSYHLIITLR